MKSEKLASLLIQATARLSDLVRAHQNLIEKYEAGKKETARTQADLRSLYEVACAQSLCAADDKVLAKIESVYSNSVDPKNFEYTLTLDFIRSSGSIKSREALAQEAKNTAPTPIQNNVEFINAKAFLLVVGSKIRKKLISSLSDEDKTTLSNQPWAPSSVKVARKFEGVSAYKPKGEDYSEKEPNDFVSEDEKQFTEADDMFVVK